MRLVLAVVALAALATAAPRGERLARAERMRERVRKAIAFLQTAKSYGEFAINTPTGLYPVGDINADNLPDVFRFRREFEELRAQEKTQLRNMMISQSNDVAPTTALGRAADKVEGSGEVEGSGIEAEKKVHLQKKNKDQTKRDAAVEEELLTDNAQHAPSAWIVAPGKHAESRRA